MDETKPTVSKQLVTAVVQRQFEPARIELALLAQTFDLLCIGNLNSTASLAQHQTAITIEPIGDLASQPVETPRRIA